MTDRLFLPCGLSRYVELIRNSSEFSVSSNSKSNDDLTGRSRLARNVAFAWAGYLVNVASGFVIPRMISDRLGQQTLGVWDFAWSIIMYFGLLQLGIGASADRYIARHRARGDMQAMSRSASTIGLSFTLSGCAILLVTVAAVWWLLPAFGGKLGGDLKVCQWVVLFLGIEGALGVVFTIYGAIIVGCHRWDVHNVIAAGMYLFMALAMIVALTLGAGLPALAAIHCFSVVTAEIIRWRLAVRICPGLRVDYRLASMTVWLEQFRFSVKNLIPRVADLLCNQTLNVLIAAVLGPAMLAIYSRPKSLLRAVQMFAAKFGSVLVPTSSSLEASSELAALQHTFRQSTRFIAAFALPGIIALVLFGDWVIRFWMGSNYVFNGLVAVLAIGSFFSITQETVWSILAGMNRHGRIALAKVAGAVSSAALLAAGLALFKFNLVMAAAAFAIPQMFVDGWFTPVYACRRIGIPVKAYYRETFLKPLWWCVPFLAFLLLARVVVQAHPWLAILLIAVGGLVLARIYWFAIVPPSRRQAILARLPLRRAPRLPESQLPARVDG